MRFLVVILFSVLVAMAACSKSAKNSDPDSGAADTDTDSDADTDADTDTDTDSDADTDTNTDIDTETDTGTNTDVIDEGELAWAKWAGGNFGDYGRSIYALSNGSALVTGYFESTATFGVDEIGETVLNSAGMGDIFIARYNADGTLVWVKRAGGSEYDFGYGISALSDGSALVTGSFYSTATFGLGETNETVLSSDGWWDIFVAKYNADGTLAWVKRAGGSDIEKSYSISALSGGSALATGYFESTATFGPGEVGETVLSSEHGRDIFVAKYNADGTLTWAKRAGGNGSDCGRALSTLPDGSVLVTGDFQDTATFGPGETGEIVIDSDGEHEIFVAKYNADGALAWAKRAGGTGRDAGYGISALPDGSALVTGHFQDTATFGPDETGETVLDSDGGYEVFVAQYSADGTLAWAKRAGGVYHDYGRSISTLSDGSALVAGEFQETATFGPGEVGETILNSFDGYGDIFVARYNADGTLAWIKRAGGESSDHGWGISALDDNSALVTGWFHYTATFGPGETNETTFNAAGGGYADMFIAKFGL